MKNVVPWLEMQNIYHRKWKILLNLFFMVKFNYNLKTNFIRTTRLIFIKNKNKLRTFWSWEVQNNNDLYAFFFKKYFQSNGLDQGLYRLFKKIPDFSLKSTNFPWSFSRKLTFFLWPSLEKQPFSPNLRSLTMMQVNK